MTRARQLAALLYAMCVPALLYGPCVPARTQSQWEATDVLTGFSPIYARRVSP